MADNNPLLSLYSPVAASDDGPYELPEIKVRPKTDPNKPPPVIVSYPGVGGRDTRSERFNPDRGGAGQDQNPLLGLYSAQPPAPQDNPLQQLYSQPSPARPSPAAAATAIGQVVAPELTKAITQGTATPPQQLPEQGKIPEVDPGVAPAAVEAVGMLPGPEMFLGAKAATLLTAAAKQEELFKGVTALKNLLSPSSTPLGKEAAVALRKATGTAAQSVEQTRAQFVPYDLAVQTMPPPQRLDLLGYMEGRSKGAQFPSSLPSGFQDYADVFRGQMKQRRDRIQAAGIEAGVIEDYVTHFWQDRSAARVFVNDWMSKQGSGKSLKARTIPTIEEGIKAGLVPMSDNPTEIAMRYVMSMDRHIALREMLDAAEQAGHIVYTTDKREVPEGWVALGGMAHNGYAPADWARIWNNFVSKGLRSNADVGDVYDAFRNLSNLTTQSILGFSGYHAVAMAKEAIASDITMGVGQVVGGLRRREAGRILQGVANVGTSPKAFIQKARTGKKLAEVYLGRTPNTIDPRQLPNWYKMASTYAEAGGRAVGKGHAFDFTFTPAGSFSTAWKRGWLKAERAQAPGTFTSAFKEAAQKVRAAGGDMNAAKKAGHQAMQLARSTMEVVSRSMSTAMAPLFEKYIPLLKNGAFADEMSSWLQMNPQASHEQQVAFAIKLIDSIDNRFGEMIQDNIMWHTGLKQIATAGMLSYSWNLGSLRLIAGGGKDIIGSYGRAFDPTSPHYSPNAGWIVAYPMAVATAAAIYQYLKTGKPPEKPADLIWPQTGGTAPGFGQHGTVPQLAILPGYEKEPWGWFYNGAQEAVNKANPFLRMGIQAMTNTDWKGDAIRRPDPTVPEWMSDTFGYMVSSLVPITLGQVWQGDQAGSAITTPERFLGIRQAPVYAQDPKGYGRGMIAMETNKWLKKLHYDFVHDVYGDHNSPAARATYNAKVRAAKERQLQYGGPQQ